MGRSPCCAKEGLNRGAWSHLEDRILTDFIKSHGEGKWRILPKSAGLKRCGKSCRLRWLNYLRPDIKRGNLTDDEKDLIIKLHKLLGNRWSLIAGRLPGRTDNEIKNYCNSNLGKKILQDGQASSSKSNTKCKPASNRSKSARQNSRTADNQPICPIPNSENVRSSCVVRTKARRCTRVFINADIQTSTQQQQQQQLGINNIIEVKDTPSRDLTNDDKNVVTDSEDSDGFMMDFGMDKFICDFLNTDFTGLERDDFEPEVAQGTAYMQTNDEANEFIDPHASQRAILDDHSDLGSMEALLD
ncbi:hypothetical protein ACH5RR_040527 [Cinchona calisaya]|uniref:Uncharacterized protein n=1 Tax=Cinchona calisaya TaxID=153742 RepID=A0ABD2XUL9_9GENT